MVLVENDALSLEYKRDYGYARRDLSLADFVNDPFVQGECRVFGLGFEEEGADLDIRQVGPVPDDAADPFLIGEQAV